MLRRSAMSTSISNHYGRKLKTRRQKGMNLMHRRHQALQLLLRAALGVNEASISEAFSESLILAATPAPGRSSRSIPKDV